MLIQKIRNVSIPIWCDYKNQSPFQLYLLGEFQFQYGAIISLYSFQSCNQFVRFQFQYGAIIRSQSYYNNRQILLFQFQYGAIISHMPLLVQPSQRSFNSNMVRL